MARIRSIKPEFCTSEAISELSLEAELHFCKLWTYADDEGRGVDNPKLIKAALWPLRDEVTSELVEQFQAELEAKGRINRYEVDGRCYFEVANWKEHQKPQHPKASDIPEPPPEPSSESHEASGSSHEASPEKLPVVGVVEEREREGSVAPRNGAELVDVQSRRSDPLFEALVAACGIDLGEIPQSARGAYNRALKDIRSLGATPDDIYEKAEAYRRAWPDASLTPTALARRWAECKPVADAPRVSSDVGVFQRFAGAKQR